MNALKNEVISHHRAYGYLKRLLCLMMGFCLVFEQAGFAQVAPQFAMPSYLQNLVPVADHFRPIQLRSMALDPETDLYTLLLDKGDAASLQPPEAEAAARKLMEYVEIGLRLPNSMFWVNLRPDSPDNIIDPNLARTDVGKILLEADLQLKKDLACFTSPKTPEGKAYWEALYEKADSVFGSEDVEIPTITRPWIVPGEIIIADAPDNIYIYKATLKVMLEQDHLKDSSVNTFSDPRLKEMNAYSSELLRTAVLPKLTREINASKRYAALRQVYYSLILAQQLKQKQGFITGSGGARIDKKDLTGLVSAQPWSSDTYYAAYRGSFAEGEYDHTEAVRGPHGISIRRYFSGGAALQGLGGSSVTKVAVGERSIEELVRSLERIYKVSFNAPPEINVVAAVEQNHRTGPIHEIRGLMAIKEDMVRIFENRQRKNGSAQLVPFDLRNPEHAREMKKYIKDNYCDSPDRATAIKLLSKNKKLAVLRATTTKVFDFVGSPSRLEDPDSTTKLDKPVLSIIYSHKYKDGKNPLTRVIIQKQLKKKGTMRMANIRLYFRVLEYLGISELGKRNNGEIVLNTIDRRLIKAWYPDIDTYAAISFEGSEDVPGAQDGGNGTQSQAEALCNTLWQNFVMEKRTAYFSHIPPTKYASEIPFDPRYVAEFRDYMKRVMLDKDGEFDSERAKRWAKQNKIFTRDFMRMIKRMLFPTEYDYIQQKALWVIYSHDYEREGGLTLAGIEERIQKPVVSDADEEVGISTVKQTINLEFLRRLGIVKMGDIKQGGARISAIVAVHRKNGTNPGTFEAVYPDIALYGTSAFKQRDNIKNTMIEMLVEAWVAEQSKKKPRSIDELLDTIGAYEVSQRLGRTNGNGVNPKSVNSAKTGELGLSKWTEDDVKAWLAQKQQGGVARAEQVAALDGGRQADIFIERLWGRFISTGGRQSYGQTPRADAAVMREFRISIRSSMAGYDKKTDFFKSLKLDINLSVAYSLYKLLFAAPDGTKHDRAGIRTLIANHNYEADGPLTVAALQSKTRVGGGVIRNYLDALEMLHAVKIDHFYKKNKSDALDHAVIAVDPDILAVWVEDYITDGGAQGRLIDGDSAEARIIQAFIKRCGVENKIKKMDPQHDLEHAGLLKSYIGRRYNSGNPQRSLNIRELISQFELEVSPVQVVRVSNFLLSQQSSQGGALVLDKPVLGIIYKQNGPLTRETINRLLNGQGSLNPGTYRFYARVLQGLGMVALDRSTGMPIQSISQPLMKLWFSDILVYRESEVRPKAAYITAFANLLADRMREDGVIPEQKKKVEKIIDNISNHSIVYAGETASPRSVAEYRRHFRTAARAGVLRRVLEENYGIVFKQNAEPGLSRVAVSLTAGTGDGGIGQPATTGGVDLRVLATEQAPAGAIDVIPPAAMSEDAVFYQKILDYVSQCRAQGEGGRIQQVRAYLATILRAEEDYAIRSAPQIKTILGLIG